MSIAPVWRSQNTPNSSTGTVSTDLPPAFAANDILLLSVSAEETAASIATPSGWTQIGSTLNSGSGTTGQKFAVFWKRATGSETTLTVADSGTWTMTSMQAISGCVTSGSPIDTSATTTQSVATSNITCPSITTGVDNALVVFTVGHGLGAGGAQFNSGQTFPPNVISPTGKRSDYTADVGGLGEGGGTACWTGAMGTAGSTGGTLSSTLGAPNNSRYCAFTISLIPDPNPFDTENGLVTESESIIGTVEDTESGTVTESEQVTVPIADSDSATVTESENISIRTEHLVFDNFNRADEISLTVSSSGHTWTPAV